MEYENVSTINLSSISPTIQNGLSWFEFRLFNRIYLCRIQIASIYYTNSDRNNYASGACGACAT